MYKRQHQSGLDVDVWFLQQPRERTLSRADTEQIEMPSMIRAAEGTINLSRWSPGYRDALKQAAQAPEVERIFVNAIIKQALCESETDRRWLEKVRPWWGPVSYTHLDVYKRQVQHRFVQFKQRRQPELIRAFQSQQLLRFGIGQHLALFIEQRQFGAGQKPAGGQHGRDLAQGEISADHRRPGGCAARNGGCLLYTSRCV